MKSQLEIEAKYDLADGQPIPDLVGVGGVDSTATAVEMVLTATYFDTAEHALSSAGATLRRRTGGEDDGWHLKLSVAEGERLEVHRPLGRSLTPPTALTSLVRAFAGSHEIGPVAVLTTRRTVHRLLDSDGRALAELADDTVTGERPDTDLPDVRWREVEIELLDGDRELMASLSAAMGASGIAPASSSSKVGRVLQVQPAGHVLDDDVRRAARALLTTDPLLRVDRVGAPERMRATVQRLSAELTARHEVTGEQPADSLPAELAWLDSAVADLDVRAHPGGGGLLDSDRYLALVQAVRRLIDPDPLPPAAARGTDV
jgi:hypothetical protein